MKSTPLAMGAIALSVGLALTGCANSDSGSGGGSGSSSNGNVVNLPTVDHIDVPADAVHAAGKGGAKCANTTTLAFVGAETGPNAQLGVNEYQGMQQAIDEHNAANPDCQVQFKKFDTEGDPNKATGPVTQAVNEQAIIGVVGLPFSGESKATGSIFDQAGLVHITASATNPTLTQNGWKTFFRGLANDNVQGPAAATLITKQLKANKVFVVQDDSDYGVGLGGQIKQALGDKLAGEDKTTTGNKDFSAIVSKITSSNADAVFYAGYYSEAAPFVQQLRAKGYKGAFVGPDGVKDDEFVKQAGNAANGAYFTCACIPGDLIPDFSASYQKSNGGKTPGTYSTEAYDAATVLLAGIDAGKTDRAGLLSWVKSYNADGIAKHLQWDDKGELAKATVYAYKADNGKIVSVGKVED